MNTRFLETFVTLAKLRNFRTTAAALHATPAAISQRLKALEDELQTVLVDRDSREFRLTPNGEYLLGYAKAVVEATQELQAAASGERAARQAAARRDRDRRAQLAAAPCGGWRPTIRSSRST